MLSESGCITKVLNLPVMQHPSEMKQRAADKTTTLTQRAVFYVMLGKAELSNFHSS